MFEVLSPGTPTTDRIVKDQECRDTPFRRPMRVVIRRCCGLSLRRCERGHLVGQANREADGKPYGERLHVVEAVLAAALSSLSGSASSTTTEATNNASAKRAFRNVSASACARVTGDGRSSSVVSPSPSSRPFGVSVASSVFGGNQMRMQRARRSVLVLDPGALCRTASDADDHLPLPSWKSTPIWTPEPQSGSSPSTTKTIRRPTVRSSGRCADLQGQRSRPGRELAGQSDRLGDTGEFGRCNACGRGNRCVGQHRDEDVVG